VETALASAATFSVGAALPLLVVLLVLVRADGRLRQLAAARPAGLRGRMAGGAALWTATARVTFWGALAMALTRRGRPVRGGGEMHATAVVVCRMICASARGHENSLSAARIACA
jgi:hypothetical protein